MSETSTIYIDEGDGFEIATNEDGYPAVKIQNQVFVEEPRYIVVGDLGDQGSDQRRRVQELIDALTEIVATPPRAGER